ncbi:MAG TPA: galactosyltransferase-related protein [Mycobacterium sp.]|nr:galactosyltransferase-related protein [Mycobacterium sp.]
MLSIIVSWRDRVELAAALPSLLGAACAVGGDLTMVNYGGSSALLRDQIGSYVDDVRVVEVVGEEYFNKGRAHNLGVAHTDQPILFFCDCDIVLEPMVVRELVELVAENSGTFGTLAGVRESELNSRNGKHVVCFGYELRIRTADSRELRIVDHEEDADNGTRHAPGLLVVRRTDFLSIGGYNSKLHVYGWGWDDQDIIARLTLGAGLRRIVQGTATHLSHDDHARVQAYPMSNRWESRDKMFRQALDNYDRADFQGTYETDVRMSRTLLL